MGFCTAVASQSTRRMPSSASCKKAVLRNTNRFRQETKTSNQSLTRFVHSQPWMYSSWRRSRACSLRIFTRKRTRRPCLTRMSSRSFAKSTGLRTSLGRSPACRAKPGPKKSQRRLTGSLTLVIFAKSCLLRPKSPLSTDCEVWTLSKWLMKNLIK